MTVVRWSRPVKSSGLVVYRVNLFTAAFREGDGAEHHLLR